MAGKLAVKLSGTDAYFGVAAAIQASVAVMALARHCL
jgi:hypothetical protein